MHKDGLELRFSDALDPELANDPESFGVRAADILWTQAYGTKEYKLGQRGATGKREQGWSDLEVTAARLQRDGKTVRLAIDGMQPAHEMEVSLWRPPPARRSAPRCTARCTPPAGSGRIPV